MKKTAMVISGIVLILGCATLGLSLLCSAVLPHAFEVYVKANSTSWDSNLLNLNMTALYVFSAVEIAVGAIGMVCFGLKAKD